MAVRGQSVEFFVERRLGIESGFLDRYPAQYKIVLISAHEDSLIVSPLMRDMPRQFHLGLDATGRDCPISPRHSSPYRTRRDLAERGLGYPPFHSRPGACVFRRSRSVFRAEADQGSGGDGDRHRS